MLVDLGYQGQKQFLIDTLSAHIQSFANDCIVELKGKFWENQDGFSCEQPPVLANPYFDLEYYTPSTFYTESNSETISGFTSDGVWVYTEICLDDE